MAWRAWGIPDVGPQYVASRPAVGSIPPDQDAAEGYRRALKLTRNELGLPARHVGSNPQISAVIERGWDPQQVEAVGLWRENLPAIEAAREAASRPVAGFRSPETMSLVSGDDPVTTEFPFLGVLLALDTRERLARDDIPGAWEDILAQFRMAQHLASSPATLSRMMRATLLHHRAIGLAFDWAGRPGQTAETIRLARDSLNSVPELPSAAKVLRVESLLIDRTLDLPAEDLREYLLGHPYPSLLVSWWERARARRLSRQLIAGLIPEAEREPWKRTRNLRFDPAPAGSPLARLIFPNFHFMIDDFDFQKVGRRAIDQVLALRSWQFSHDGKYPDELGEIVPSELDRLPIDPYSGRPFRYVRSEGQPALSIMPIENRPWAVVGSVPNYRPTRPGQPILYSVGLDGKDDGGHVTGTWGADILFPLP